MNRRAVAARLPLPWKKLPALVVPVVVLALAGLCIVAGPAAASEVADLMIAVGADPAADTALRFPYPPSLLADEPDAITSAPLNLELSGSWLGEPVELAADYRSAAVGLSLAGPQQISSSLAGCEPAEPEPGQSMECHVRVLRLAQHGTVTLPDGSTLRWLAELAGPAAGSFSTVYRPGEDEGARREAMAQRAVAEGAAAARDRQGEMTAAGLVYPAELSLELPLRITVQAGDGPVQRLVADRPFTLSGQLAGWPSYTREWPPQALVLTLSGPPVTFRLEPPRQTALVITTDDQPKLVIDGVVAALGTQPTSFFAERPEITEVSAMAASGAPWNGVGAVIGAQVTWRESADRVTDTAITHYSIYRRIPPGAAGGDECPAGPWRLVARLPAGQPGDEHRTEDSGFEGTCAAEYLITHGVELPFRRHYEGVYGPSVRLEAVVQQRGR